MAKNQREVLASYNTGLTTVYDIKQQKEKLWLFIALSKSMNDVFKWEISKEAKLAPLDKALYKWFTAMGSKGKTVTGPMIIKIAVLLWRNGNNWQVHIALMVLTKFTCKTCKNLGNASKFKILDNLALVWPTRCWIKEILLYLCIVLGRTQGYNSQLKSTEIYIF